MLLSQWRWRISQSQDLRIYPLKKHEVKFSSQVSVCNIIKIGFQDCLLNQRWLRNLCGELCGIESMQSKNTKEKTASRFVPEISLVRCAHLFDFQYYQLVRKIPYGQTFHEVFSIDWIVITALDSSSVYDVHNLSTEISPCKLEKML